jgi:hypothetical protein
MAVSPLDRRPKRALGTSLESLLSLMPYSLIAVTLALAPLLVPRLHRRGGPSVLPAIGVEYHLTRHGTTKTS